MSVPPYQSIIYYIIDEYSEAISSYVDVKLITDVKNVINKYLILQILIAIEVVN